MIPSSRAVLREVRLYLPGPAGDVLDRFEASLRRAGSFVVARTDWSLAARPVADEVAPNSFPAPTAGPTNGAVAADVIAGRTSPGPGTIPVGGAQIALVPIQADPGSLRVWISWAPGIDPVGVPITRAVDDFVASERDASRQTQQAIDAREDGRDAVSAFEAQAANIRRALATSGVAPDAIERRLRDLRTRWSETRRRANGASEDEPPEV